MVIAPNRLLNTIHYCRSYQVFFFDLMVVLHLYQIGRGYYDEFILEAIFLVFFLWSTTLEVLDCFQNRGNKPQQILYK